MNVKFWNYGVYSSSNYGAHSIAFTDAYGNTYYYSYQTMVAFKPRCGKLYVHENDWGTTTGKHLNWIDGGDKQNRLSDEDFKEKFGHYFANFNLELSA